MVSLDEIDNAEGLDVEEAKNDRKDEDEEVAVVAFADAVSDPRAVMIEVLYAVIAYSAVDGSHWAVKIACVCRGTEQSGGLELRGHLRPTIWVQCPNTFRIGFMKRVVRHWEGERPREA